MLVNPFRRARGVALACVSGIAGGAGAAVGKVALSGAADALRELNADSFSWGDLNVRGIADVLVARGALFALMLLVNAGMVAAFLEAHRSADAVSVNVASSSANFIASSLIGFVYFGESADRLQDPLWWLGMVLIVAGVGVVQSAQVDRAPSGETKKEE